VCLRQITETWAIGLLPNWIVQYKLHRPMRFHVGGTMLALGLALQHGWSINLGGARTSPSWKL
jgi:histone deacetylase 11